MKMTSKRKRSSNFSLSEKELLVQLITEKKSAIENKKVDAASLRLKDGAWEEVTANFNSQNDAFRSMESLKILWDNLKKRARRSHAENKTGEGSCESKKEYLNDMVKDVLKVSFDGLPYPYDCDAECNKGFDNEFHVMSDDDDDDDGDEDEDVKEYEDIFVPEVLYQNKQSDFSTASLKTELSDALTDCVQQSSQQKQSTAHDACSLDTEHKKITHIQYLHRNGETDIVQSSETQNIHHSQHNQTTSSDNPGPSSIQNVPSPENRTCHSSDQTRNENSSRKRLTIQRDLTAVLLRHKIDLAVMAKQHAKAEEKRKSELHALEMKEKKMKCKLAELEVAEKKLKISAMKIDLVLRNAEDSSEQ